MGKDAWQTFMRVTIFIWFIIVNLLVLVPSFQLLLDAEPKGIPKKMPAPPVTPQIAVASEASQGVPADVQARQLDVLKKKADIYQQAIQTYEKHVAAYNKLVEQSSKICGSACGWSKIEIYKLVVKDTLVTLITTMLASLVGYAFVSIGGELLRNYLQKKGDVEGREVSSA